MGREQDIKIFSSALNTLKKTIWWKYPFGFYKHDYINNLKPRDEFHSYSLNFFFISFSKRLLHDVTLPAIIKVIKASSCITHFKTRRRRERRVRLMIKMNICDIEITEGEKNSAVIIMMCCCFTHIFKNYFFNI